jgi:E3 ubiquitin-protein ligase MARCH5
VIELYDRFLYGTSPFAAATIVIGSIYWSAVSYGALTVLQVFGHDQGKEVLESADPLMLLIGLPSIPFMLIAGKLFRWEDQILRLWKNHYNKVPGLSYFVGEPAPDTRESAEKILIGRDSYSDPISSTRLFCGALVLPTVSTLFGRFLFPSVDSHLKRTLFGGVTFIVVKGFLRIILRQQQYIRQSKRKVVNYNDVTFSVDKSSSTDDC